MLFGILSRAAWIGGRSMLGVLGLDGMFFLGRACLPGAPAPLELRFGQRKRTEG